MSVMMGICMAFLAAGAGEELKGVGQGVVISPRITVEGQPDYTDLGRFAQFYKDKGLVGQDLAMAVWQRLCGKETGIYHFNEIFEGRETDYALGNVRDPLKIMNVYNHGFCGIHGPVLEGVFRGAGFEARSFGVPGWIHCTTEVYYDDAWHYFDLDVRGALMRADGVIASVEEARTIKELWTDPPRKIEPFFPKDRDKAKVFEAYAKAPPNFQYHWAMGGWTTDHVLRPGESLRRWWRNRNGRWHHLGSYTGWKRKLLEKQPRGIKPNHADFSVWGVGSALFVYQPDLTDATADVELGAYSIENIKTTAQGLTLAKVGSGSVVFEVLSPYIIVPIMDDLDEPDNLKLNRDAATVMIEATGTVLGEVSTDGGRTWSKLGGLGDKARLDLTRHVRGRYGYLIRLILTGEPEQVVVGKVELRTWGQIAPISIPRLAKGKNVLQLGVNDRRHGPTRMLAVLPDLGRPADIKSYGITIEGKYDADDVKQRIRGRALVPIEAPPGQRIDWLSVGGMFQAVRGARARETATKIEIATSPDGPFKTVYDAAGTVPDWNDHWHYAMDVEAVLGEPAERVYVRYTGDPGCNAIRIYAHCGDPRPANTGVVRVTHTYDLGDERMVKTVEVRASGGGYSIDCRSEPTNVSLALEVPHAGRGR